MNRQELEDWQNHPVTREILSLYEDALGDMNDMHLNPEGFAPDEFWKRSMKIELGRQAIYEFLSYIKSDAIAEESDNER